nr:hypothetical protein MFLOJ_08730 [Mycobacterium florentinum]
MHGYATCLSPIYAAAIGVVALQAYLLIKWSAVPKFQRVPQARPAGTMTTGTVVRKILNPIAAQYCFWRFLMGPWWTERTVHHATPTPRRITQCSSTSGW